ncbi:MULTISPECIES: TRAP transporter large permease [unclassified Oceanispirochaeta]|uniref:TRAP transporter large permease n=1 Tax=unclassified Oceanispirochaeta TaxID=2635722 RepID=UPI000E094160|nr:MULTISPECIES: TRAP transporter large permease [unclassified Oceanispirochaeta]MBF9017517.1 TRAP transporter large permease [Oceanispirochaeta sp. M2]NPD74089.1 TRAP transporter large permease [Oceanispirochaeta sp. M1]RDG30130.1 TRAP transporter large permease [Oceanispirochaeta sp. M1]
MSPVQIGIIGTLILFGLLFTSMPVAFAMIASGVLGFALIISPQAAFSMVIAELFETFSAYNLTVIPLFVMMGQVSFHAGISKRLFHTTYVWLGHLKGGLAMATVGACAGFGAICGSGPATAATMASVALPEMKRYGYADSLASGSVAAGGSLGMLIPPSVVFIVYALMTEQSIGDLFLAGIVPGILIVGLFCVNIYIRSSKDPSLGPAGPKHSWKERFQSLNGIIETVLLFLLVMGGMFLGLFTPIEAAAIGAAGSFVIALVQKEMSFVKLKKILLETVRTSSMVFFIVAGATIFGRFLAVSRIPFVVAEGFVSLPLPGEVVMMLIILFFLVAGCFIDALALMLLTIPIFFPVIQQLGFDPIWFGVIVVVITQMGVITPPVGVNVYVVSGIERDIPLPVIFKGSMPFLGMLILAAVILIALPDLCLFLPRLVNKS